MCIILYVGLDVKRNFVLRDGFTLIKTDLVCDGGMGETNIRFEVEKAKSAVGNRKIGGDSCCGWRAEWYNGRELL
jgi:hypothetical protein